MQLPSFFGLNLTQILILSTIIIWCLYDVVVRILVGNNATISVTIRVACANDQAWSLAIGLLVGHLLLSGK